MKTRSAANVPFVRHLAAAAALLQLLAAGPASAGSKYQTNLVATAPDCLSFAGYCLNVDAACTFIGDNADCAAATVSPRSKVILDGKLALKAVLAGVTDGARAPLTTDPDVTDASALILKLSLSDCPVDTGAPPICDDLTQTVYVKVALKHGAAHVAADLSSALAGIVSGNPVVVLGVSLLAPAAAGDCPGDNSAAAIAARLNMLSCENGAGIVRAVAGVLKP